MSAGLACVNGIGQTRITGTTILNLRFASSATGLALARSTTFVTVVIADASEVREDAAETLLFTGAITLIALSVTAFTGKRDSVRVAVWTFRHDNLSLHSEGFEE
jgi:hypothetical protein